jgi:hypothetical protein
MWVRLTCGAPNRNISTAPPAVISDLLAVDLRECTGGSKFRREYVGLANLQSTRQKHRHCTPCSDQ